MSIKSNRRSRFAIAIAALVAIASCMIVDRDAWAERTIQIGAAKRTSTVSVFIGKSEDVRTESSFVELTVGDPEIVDDNPLTDRSLWILGKKNGTTRVSAYAEGKKLIGCFDGTKTPATISAPTRSNFRSVVTFWNALPTRRFPT